MDKEPQLLHLMQAGHLYKTIRKNYALVYGNILRCKTHGDITFIFRHYTVFSDDSPIWEVSWNPCLQHLQNAPLGKLCDNAYGSWSMYDQGTQVHMYGMLGSESKPSSVPLHLHLEVVWHKRDEMVHSILSRKGTGKEDNMRIRVNKFCKLKLEVIGNWDICSEFTFLSSYHLNLLHFDFTFIVIIQHFLTSKENCTKRCSEMCYTLQYKWKMRWWNSFNQHLNEKTITLITVYCPLLPWIAG